MNNAVVVPLLIPLLTAILLTFAQKNTGWQRFVSVIGLLANIVFSGWLVCKVQSDGIQVLQMGGWPAPFGIVFVADMFSVLLVFASSLVALACLVFAFHSVGEERERHYFYPFLHFLLAGVNGSFLTGDLFNLFVCFEVMLISSYVLLVHGGMKSQLRETVKYMVINMIASALFVAAIAYLYSVAGTLNMAHIAERVAQTGQGGILTVLAFMLMLVFALKAGLFLFYWLPGSYRVPPVAVMAIFGALLTKVGIYSLVRVFTLVFVHEPELTHAVLGGLAALTMLLGSAGALAHNDIFRIFNYNIVISVGFVAFGLAVATSSALNGVTFYLLHDMVAKALLFLAGGVMAAAAGVSDTAKTGGLIRKHPYVGWMFFILVLSLFGMPPFSGFTGKLLIIQSGFAEGWYVIGGIALFSSLIVLYSLMRVFVRVFWGAVPEGESGHEPAFAARPRWSWITPAFGLFFVMLLIGFGSEWVYSFVSQAGVVLTSPDQYIGAVLGGGK